MAQERIPQGGQLAVYDPFQSFFNQIRAGQVPQQLLQTGRNVASAISSPMGTRLAGMGLPALYGTGSLVQGDIAQGVGEIGGGLLGANLVGGIASGLEKGGTRGKLLGGAVRLAGGLLGGGIGGGIAGGTARAAEAAMGSAQQREMARGESPGTLGIPGLGAKDIGGLDAGVIERLARATGKTQVEVAEALYPLQQRGRDADLQRQMQINQQTGQITGALNRQLYMAQLAGGAQAQAGETVRTMMTAPNPYAASAFQYRG